MQIWKQVYDSIIHGKREKVIAISLAVLVLALFLLVFLAVSSGLRGSSRSEAELFAAFDNRDIDIHDLFLEDEPDILPAIRLSREAKPLWTTDDAQEFWTGFPDSDIDYWQNLADETIDNMLEAVP